MNECRSVTINSIITSALWSAVFVFLAAAWISTLADDVELAVMFGFTSCILTGATCVFAVRCAAARTRSVIRSLCGGQGERLVGELHSLS